MASSPILAHSRSVCHVSFGGGGGTVELRSSFAEATEDRVGELGEVETCSAVARSGRRVMGGGYDMIRGV